MQSSILIKVKCFEPIGINDKTGFKFKISDGTTEEIAFWVSQHMTTQAPDFLKNLEQKVEEWNS